MKAGSGKPIYLKPDFEIGCAALYVIMFLDGKRYFGISAYPNERWMAHRAAAKTGTIPLYIAMREAGLENIGFRILALGPTDYIRRLEIAAIDHFESLVSQNGYNVIRGGGVSTHKGRRAASLRLRCKPVSDAAKANMRLAALKRSKRMACT